MAETNPPSWSQHLPWVEYAHNNLPSSATGLSPFEAFLGYQPPLLPSEEVDLVVPAVQDHIRHCQKVWQDTRSALECTQESNQVNRRRNPAPLYQPGQSVWLATRNIPLLTESCKLSRRFIGPFPFEKVINPTVVRLTLPSNIRIHPTFHVSQLKPVSSSTLFPLDFPCLVCSCPFVVANKAFHIYSCFRVCFVGSYRIHYGGEHVTTPVLS